MTIYRVIVNGKYEEFHKEKIESFYQFKVRLETFIKAIELGYDNNIATMLASKKANIIKYNVGY